MTTQTLQASTAATADAGAAAAPLFLVDGSLEWVVLLLVGLFLIYSGFRKYRTSQLIRNTPTQNVRSLAAGRAELEGTVLPADQALDQPFTDGKCVYAEYEIEEYRDQGDDGKEWVTVASGSISTPFYLEDDTGKVLVDPEDVTLEVDDENTTEFTVGSGQSDPGPVVEFLQGETSGLDDPKGLADEARSALSPREFGLSSIKSLYTTAQSPTSLLTGVDPNASARRRYSQAVLPVFEDAYVFGYAEILDEQPDISIETEDRLKMTKDEMTGRFILSDQCEDGVAGSLRRTAPLLMGGGLLLSTVSFYYILTLLGLG